MSELTRKWLPRDAAGKMEFPAANGPIKSMVGSSGRQRVQESCFEKSMVWVPPRSFLNLFSEIAVPIFQQIKVLHSQNQKLRYARDLLMPRLMDGTITV